MRTPHRVILFDGVCNLCNGLVQFVIDRDPYARFVFAPLQGDEARRLLAARRHAGGDLGTVLLVEDGRVYDRSTACLRIARHLSGAWPLAYAFILVPRPLRDLVYGWVARNRYAWFGREESCRIPTPELRARFLTEAPAPAAPVRRA